MNTRKLVRPPYIYHGVLWLFFLTSLVSDVYLTLNVDPTRFFIYVLSKSAVIIALVYTHLGIFHPLLFKRKKYVLYGVTAFLLCAVVGIGNTLIEVYHNANLRGREQEVIWGQFTMALRYLFIAFLLQVVVDYYRQKEMIKKIELEKLHAELKFLKAQVNPHFLFNTLNNLYALILQRSDKSAESVLKLADIMKYILAEGKEDKVPLEKEIKLIRDYTDLESLRKSDAAIGFRVTGHINGQLITPLLLLPLIENAFKYGLNTVARNGFVNIAMNVEGNTLDLSVENNSPLNSNKEAIQSLGIGIDNVKRRLELVYQDRYYLKLVEEPAVFRVLLQLNLK